LIVDSANECRWRVTPGQALRYRQWQDEYVLYNDLSGDTHLLDGDAMQLLLALQQAPRDLAALAVALGAANDAETLADLGALTEQLHALSLLESIPC
jgi:PqqD family protein of HPr-rel-A system